MKLRNEPKVRAIRDYYQSGLASGPFSLRRGATGGMRSSDVVDNIGETPRSGDVNGRLAISQDWFGDIVTENNPQSHDWG